MVAILYMKLKYRVCDWILIPQTMDKDVTLRAEFGPMIRFSLQGILTVKIQDGGHLCK